MTPWQHFIATRAARITALRLHPNHTRYTRQTARLINLAANSVYADALLESPEFAARVKGLLTARSSTNA